MGSIHPLRTWRQDQSLTQEEAAKLLNLKVPTLSRYETGRRVPSLGEAARLSKRTGIPWRNLRPDLAELTERAEQAAQGGEDSE